MRRAVILLSLIFAAFPLTAADWFASGPVGIPGDPLEDMPETGWALSVEVSGSTETHRLYLDTVFQSSTVYKRQNGRLMSREDLNADGELVSRVQYVYDADGNPRAFYLSGTDDDTPPRHVETFGTVQADQPVQRQRIGIGDRWTLTDRNRFGDPVHYTVAENGEVIQDSVWQRTEDGLLTEEIHEQDGEIRRIVYNEEGRPAEETVSRNEAVVLQKLYTWDQSRLLRTEERGDGQVFVTERTWEDEVLVSEKRFTDDEIVSRTLYTGENERTEILYRNGEEVIRAYWADGVLQREEFLSNGEILRVRE